MKRLWTGWRLPVAVWLVLCMALPLAWASGHHGGEGPLTINWWEWSNPHAPPMGWFLLDFAMFLGGLVYFVGTPLRTALSERHGTIKRSISEAASAHAKASSRQAQVRDKLARMESEAQALATSSQTDGQAEHDKIVAEAKAYAARLQQDSSTIVQQERKRAEERLRHKLSEAALHKAAATLARELDTPRQQTLLEHAIAELEAAPAGEGQAS